MGLGTGEGVGLHLDPHGGAHEAPLAGPRGIYLAAVLDRHSAARASKVSH